MHPRRFVSSMCGEKRLHFARGISFDKINRSITVFRVSDLHCFLRDDVLPIGIVIFNDCGSESDSTAEVGRRNPAGANAATGEHQP